MKLFETLALESLSKILNGYAPKPITESVDFSKMQAAVYAYVLKKMKDVPSDAKFESENDTFWVSEFDDVHKDLENDNITSALDSLYQAVVAVSVAICDWYSDAMNFPPGYKPVKLKAIHPLDQDLMKIINDLDPKMAEREIAWQKERTEKNKAVKAEKRKAAADKLSEIAAVLKKHESVGWDKFLKDIKRATHQTVHRFFEFMPEGTTEEEFFSLKTTNQLKDFIKTKSTDAEYVETLANNVGNLDRIPNDEIYLVSLAFVASQDKHLSKKLAALVR